MACIAVAMDHGSKTRPYPFHLGLLVLDQQALPPLAPQHPALYTVLRGAHGALGYALFALVLAHVAGALYHAWVRRDGVFEAMTGKR